MAKSFLSNTALEREKQNQKNWREKRNGTRHNNDDTKDERRNGKKEARAYRGDGQKEDSV